MRHLPGIRPMELVYTGDAVRVMLALDEERGEPVILKVLSLPFPTSADRARFRREHDLLAGLGVAGVPRVHGYLDDPAEPAMVLELVRGATLASTFSEAPASMAQFFAISTRAAAIIGAVHERSIIHKDISPGNLMWDPAASAVALIDFGIASRLPSEYGSVPSGGHLEGTLPFIAPEQTGRIGRPVDARSDLYGLGATLYFLLTGAPPFSGVDALELIHAHIALQPPPPRAHRPEVPAGVERVVLKLLEKDPAHRYRSVHGLLRDLERCERAWRDGDADLDFDPGADDRVARLAMPDRLYGRDAEMAALEAAFLRACRGESRSVFIQGYAGIGKSALITRLMPALIEGGARLCRGKFDQFRRDMPLAALSDLIEGLIADLLREGGPELDGLIGAWQDACGANLVLLADLAPALARHLPDLPPAPRLNPADARNRLIYTLTRFFAPLARPGRPLVLFFDDLQWADPSSVALIRQLGLDGAIAHLLVIGAMRDAEVGVDHALWECLERFRERGVVDELSLGPLDRDTIRAFVADALQTDEHTVGPLADALHRRSAGNPFFLRTVLADMAASEALRFNRLSARWQWDLDRLDDDPIAGDVVGFLRDRMATFDPQTRRALAASACVGVSFCLDAVATAVDLPLGRVVELLRDPARHELVQPLSTDHELVASLDEEDPASLPACPFRFAHDRIQQAAHGLVTPQERAVFHWRVGLRMMGPEPTDEGAIAVAGHLNRGAGAPEAAGHGELLLDVNLRAGRRARSAGAFEEAWDFLVAAMALLPSTSHAGDRELKRRLLMGLSEIAYLTGRLDEAEARVAELSALSTNPTELAESRLLQAVQNTTLGRVEAAVDAGIEGLAALGLRMTRRPSKLRLARGLLGTRLRLLGRSLDAIRALPDLTEPRHLVTAHLISQLGISAYLSGDDDLFALCVLQGVRFTLRHGHCPESGVFFISYGVILAAVIGDLPGGRRHGDLGRELHARSGDTALKGRVGFLHAMLTASWNEHRGCLAGRFAAALQDALAAGDLLYASFAAAHVHQWNPGWDLDRAIAAGERSLAVLRANRHQDVWDSTRVAHQLRLNLSGRTLHRLSLSDETFDAQDCLRRMEASGYRTGVTVFHITSMQMCCHYGAFERGFAHARAAERELDTVIGQTWMLEFWTCGAIVAAEAARSPETRKAALRFLRRARRKLAKWAAHCPVNFEHASALAEAEHHALRGEPFAAMACFERAADAARGAGFRELEALAVERAGAHLLRCGRETVAAAWCTEAWRLYLGWGADEKAAHLAEIWRPHLRVLEHAIEGGTGPGMTTGRGRRATSSKRGELDIDMISVMKASQALSSEIDIDRLLEKMLRIVMENAGAATGLLLLRRGGRMCLQASARDGGAQVDILPVARPVSEWDGDPEAPMPLSVIHAVLDSKRPMVIADATAEPRTARDPYIVAGGVKSVLCAPISSQGRLLALVYLENRAAAGFFSEERVEVLDLLASQMSISLENALLYRDLVEANARLGRAFERQRTLMQSYHRFVPQELLGLLGKESITDIGLGTHVEAEMTILFSDIRGFTAISERMSPQDNFNFINSYLSEMEPIISDHGGFIDKYIGDAIMALFPGEAARRRAARGARAGARGVEAGPEAGTGEERAGEERHGEERHGEGETGEGERGVDGAVDGVGAPAGSPPVGLSETTGGDDGGATAALGAAVAMLRRLRAFNADRVAAGEAPLRIGIGLNTGRIMLGTVGGANRMDGTVISDAVNVSSRIEGLTGHFGALLLVSEQTLARVQSPDRHAHRFIGRVPIRGKREPVGLYEVYDGDEPEIVAAKRATKAVFEGAVDALERGELETARGGFEEALARCPTDVVARRLLAQAAGEAPALVAFDPLSAPLSDPLSDPLAEAAGPRAGPPQADPCP